MGQTMSLSIAYGWDAGNDDDIPEWAEGLFIEDEDGLVDTDETDEICIRFSGVDIPRNPYDEVYDGRPDSWFRKPYDRSRLSLDRGETDEYRLWKTENREAIRAYRTARLAALAACPFEFDLYGFAEWGGRTLIVKDSKIEGLYDYGPHELDLVKMVEDTPALAEKADKIVTLLDVEMPEAAWITSMSYG